MKKTTLMAFALSLLTAPVFAENGGNFKYLALGDSVPFGLNPLLLPPFSMRLPEPEQFIGYPEVVAAAEDLELRKAINASCPGETSGSFLDVNAPDNGCNSSHFQPPAPTIPPFKTGIGLHTKYLGAQMDFAELQLKTDKQINLVTLSIGANDILLALPQLVQCGADIECANKVLGPVLQSYAANLAQILSRVRAKYQGPLIVVKYYSPSPALDGVTMAVNRVMTQVAANFAVTFADGFTAFQLASAGFNHDACQAGLLIRLPPSTPAGPPCDIHPSPRGRDLLAATVELAAGSRHDVSDRKDESDRQ